MDRRDDVNVYTLSLKLRYESSVMPKSLTEATGPDVWPDRPRSKYWHFLLFIIGNNDLVVFAIFKTSSLVLCSVHVTLNILIYFSD